MKARMMLCRWSSSLGVFGVVALVGCSDQGSDSDSPTTGTPSTTVGDDTVSAASTTSAGTSGGVGTLGATTGTSAGTASSSAATVTSTSGTAAASSGSGGETSASASATGAAGAGGATSAAAGGATASTTGGNDAVPSPGCTSANPPSSGPFSIDVESTEREYILRLPEDYDPTRPYPLILAWHGAQYSAEWVDTGGEPQSGPYFGVQAEADGDAIFVAPQALTGSWTNQNGRDLAFADAMVERFEAELCLDESRLFSIGFSMGAIMTIRIGCARADKFRAIAPLSASLPNDCAEGDLPIAYFSAHGDIDETITDDQGMLARDEFVRRNGCSDQTVDLERERCVAFEGCDAGYPVEWCSFTGEHVPAPFAGEAIWQFLSQL